MPLFIDENSHKIVYRKHAINTEVLDGDLTTAEEYLDCFIISHITNKKFGYNIGVHEETNPQEGFDKVQRLGTKETSELGQPYYEVIPAIRLNEYAADPTFTLTLGEATPNTDKQETKAIVNEQPVEIGKRVQETENIENGVKRTKYKVSLAKDVNGERPL